MSETASSQDTNVEENNEELEDEVTEESSDEEVSLDSLEPENPQEFDDESKDEECKDIQENEKDSENSREENIEDLVESFAKEKKQKDDFIQSLSQFSTILSERARRKDRSLLAMVLESRTPSERERILQVAYLAGVEGDDPLFAVLLATGQLELLLSKKPEELNLIFDRWQQRWNEELQYADAMFEQQSSKLRHFLNRAEKTFELQSRAALDVQSKSISDSVNHLVKGAAYEKVSHDMFALIRAGSILLGAIGIGVFIGLAIPKLDSANAIAVGEAKKLTREQVKALDWGLGEAGRFGRNNPEFMRWARSDEGRYARSLMQWNQTLLSDVGWGERLCERDAKELGITLKVDGREAKSGFCVLWVKPPGQRQILK
jgi:hypothetical protein